MKNSILRVTLLISLALNISVIGTAGYLYYKQSGDWISPFGTKLKKDRFLFEELSLRPEQMSEMKSRAIFFRSEIDRKRYEITQKRRDLIGLIRMDTPDVNAIKAVISDISRLQEEMQKKVAVHMLEEKAVLDKEQQQKFLDLIEETMTQGRHAGCPPTEHK